MNNGLEKAINELKRLEAVQEVLNVMGRYSFLHTAGKHSECADFFALKTREVRAEMVWGVYDGPSGIKRLYPDLHQLLDGDGRGMMHQHALTTSVVEIAEDAQTAKAIWVSPGHETFMEEGLIKSVWAWAKYGADFIMEDGKWKIWHLHVYGILWAPYEQSWVDVDNSYPYPPVPTGLLPDSPPTTHWMYASNRVTELVPAPPTQFVEVDIRSAY